MKNKTLKMTPQFKALLRAIELAGGQSKLVRKLGYKKPSCIVSNWVTVNKHIPEGKLLQVSLALNGAMTPAELRPDLPYLKLQK